ncbi:MAG: COX15/CtaA family protein [Deltaproteobacteria bacterium]|nr:COX15/CtaA family protein [Deltaproteobacteria bacterium]
MFGTTSSTRYAKFAWGILGFNVLVILWGAVVRATGSGAGCGSHWPLCNGAVLPRGPEAATIIEFAHRVSSGLAALLVLALIAGAWRAFPRGHRVRSAAVWSGLFMLSEALIGAALVLLELVAQNTSSARGLWVAGHLVNTLLLLAALALTAWWASGGPAIAVHRQGVLPLLIAASLGGVLVLGMSGAVTALGDTLFPAASLAEGKAQTFSATAHLFVRLRLWHPVLAVVFGSVLLITAAAAAAARASAGRRALAIALVGLYVAQLLIGVVNVWYLAPTAVQIVHLLFADLVWIALVLLAASALAADEDTAVAAR